MAKRIRPPMKVHMHITLPMYLAKFTELLADKHGTSRNSEIENCVLLRYLNCGEV